MAKYWMHNGYVNINEKKMSKSLNNFITVKKILEKFDGETLRYFLLQTHYRSPLNYKENSLVSSKSSLSKLYRATENFVVAGQPDNEILLSLENDLNTPRALSRAHYLAEESNRGSKEAGQLLKNSSKLLGFMEEDTNNWFKQSKTLSDNNLNNDQIEKLIQKRNIAKINKQFEIADNIRDDLFKHGIILEDTPIKTKWRRG